MLVLTLKGWSECDLVTLQILVHIPFVLIYQSIGLILLLFQDSASQMRSKIQNIGIQSSGNQLEAHESSGREPLSG